MRLSRRELLHLLGGVLAAGSGSCTRSAPIPAPEIHRLTRNTWRGAVGERPDLTSRPAPFKDYQGSRTVALPAVASHPGLPLAAAVRRYRSTRAFQAAPLPLGSLARLLHFTNGVTGRSGQGDAIDHLRAAPSAGALYAGELYLVAQQVQGLDPGIYYYRVIDHALCEIRSGSFLGQVAGAVERSRDVDDAAAAILLTNVFHRYAWRYANRGYRYALIDTGHIGENLRLAARSAGFGEIAPLRFHDDRLDALLGVDGRQESVCALHALGRAALSGAEPSPGTRSFVEKQRLDPRADLRTGSVTERYHEATKLVPAGGTPVLPSSPPAPPLPLGSGRPLPTPGSGPLASVEGSIRIRRSARRFREHPISVEELGFVTEMAKGQAALERAPGVELLLVVHRVDGLDPGVYRYQPGAHALVLVRGAELNRSLVRACLNQRRAGTGAVGFLMVADLAEAAARAGDRSYRDLLVEAGGIGQRIYLAAEAVGLAARNLAAFVDDDLNALVGLDGRDRAVLHLTMLGPGD